METELWHRHRKNPDKPTQWWVTSMPKFPFTCLSITLKQYQDKGKALKLSQIREVGI